MTTFLAIIGCAAILASPTVVIVAIALRGMR
jgi:hypothetical protein